jgi:hypothetical protein
LKLFVKTTLGLIVLAIAVRWLFGASPYEQYMELIHNDIPRLAIPVRLEQGVPTTFQARIIHKRAYRLNLLVHFHGKEQRAVVEDFIGGPVTEPGKGVPPGKLATTFRVTIRNHDQRIVQEQVGTSNGSISAGMTVGRDIVLLPLDEGLYTVGVVPLSDVSRLAPFQTELELTFLAK